MTLLRCGLCEVIWEPPEPMQEDPDVIDIGCPVCGSWEHVAAVSAVELL